MLSPFHIYGEQQGRYQPTETTSGGRVRVAVFDATQSVSVVTRELVEDVGAARLLDVLQYISGVTESTIPNGLDRTTIRGFQTDGERIDNFSSPNQINLDPVFVERIEVVKGPNAILAPAGVPGGTINAVTRKPLYENAGSIAGMVGLYNANRIEWDFNRVLNDAKTLAFRVVGAWQNTEGFAGDDREIFVIMPMLSYRMKNGGEFVVQLPYTNSRVQNWFGLPIDPSAGTDTEATLLHGVPRDLNTADNDYRYERRPEIRALLTLPIVDSLSMRLAARYTDFKIGFLQNLDTNAVSGGAVDPRTGLFTPGTVYGPAPTFTPSPAPVQSRTFLRNGTEDLNRYWLFNLQNDYSHVFESDHLKATTVAGGSFDMTRQRNRVTASTKAPIDFNAPAPAVNTLGNRVTAQDTVNYAEQIYISETLSLLDDRVILTGGFCYNNYDQSVLDRIPAPDVQYNVNIDADLLSYGILVKPLPDVAVFYSYSENATPNSAYNIGRNAAAPLQSGEQKEVGIRTDFFEHRFSATLAYFDILQSNYSVPNPGNYVPVPPVPPLPPLVSDRKARGWELEFRATINTQLSLIGNYTDFKNRDPNDVPFRGTAERSWGAWMNYQLPKDSALSGLSASVGVTYLDKRPGDAVSGVTAASTADNQIPVQPSFYLPERTLVNLSATYKFAENWRIQVNVENLFDEDYLAASINRSVVIPGDERNVRAWVTYTF